MCLLIVGKSNALRAQLLNTSGLLEDIYLNNKDGLGAMFSADGQVVVRKILPKKVKGARHLIGWLPDDDREVALHFRMRTHGDIDLENCHPYKINDGAWIMHNGILHTGNNADKTKSDTWHFARDFLAGLPHDALHHHGVQEMMGDYVRSNRFAICTDDGRISVTNREQGIEHEGVWYSNTYAWEPSILIPTYANTAKVYRGVFGSWQGHGGKWSNQSSVVVADSPSVRPSLGDQVDEYLYEYNPDHLADLLEKNKEFVVGYILREYALTRYDRYDPNMHTKATNEATEAWTKGDKDALMKLGPSTVAQALVFCCDWVHKSELQSEADELIDVDAVETGEQPEEPDDTATVHEFRAVLERDYGPMALGYESGASQ